MDQAVICLWCDARNLSTVVVSGKTYYQCRQCDYLFLDPRFRLTAVAEKARYELHNNDVRDAGYQAFVTPMKNEVTKIFGTKSIGLDYGSGTDSAISFLLTNENYTINKYDPLFNSDTCVLSASSYDFVLVCEVAEHLYAPAAEFKKIFSLLKPGGAVFVMTSLLSPAIDFPTWSYRRDETHVGFFSAKTFALNYKTEVKSRNLIILRQL